MTNSKQNKGKEEKVGGISTVVAAVAGAIAGAGVAITGAIIMSDKKNRDKVEGVINNFKEEVGDKKDEVEKKFLEEKENIKNAVIGAVDSLETLVEDTKNKATKTAKQVKGGIEEKVEDVTKKINKTWQK